MLTILKHIYRHPLNREHRFAGVLRFIRWQIANRIMPVPMIVPYVNNSCLVMERGMTGATGNFYTGLDELSDMTFLLHFLREEDLFCDVGANIGSYSVLASAVVGAHTFSFEPIPTTFDRLKRNVEMNRIGGLVALQNIGIGSRNESLKFIFETDSTNHVASEKEISQGNVIELPVRRLDEVLDGKSPSLIKIDVEGWEPEALAGMPETLANPTLKAIIIETNELELRYSNQERKSVSDVMDQFGFTAHIYDPFSRTLIEGRTLHNTIYVRDSEFVKERVQNAPRFSLINGSI